MNRRTGLWDDNTPKSANIGLARPNKTPGPIKLRIKINKNSNINEN